MTFAHKSFFNRNSAQAAPSWLHPIAHRQQQELKQ
jgi:hypothetical protein